MRTPLAEWAGFNKADEQMIWKKPGDSQPAFFQKIAEILGGEASVVSTHRSKSVTLPVVEIVTPYGVKAVLRDNFHDVKVSVWTPKACEHDLFGLAAGSDSYLSSCYFEGFSDAWIHEPFVIGCTRFSASSGLKGTMSIAKVLRWLFDGRDSSVIAGDEVIDGLVSARSSAEAEGLPVCFNPGTTSVLFRFFEASKDLVPDLSRLREILIRQAPGYDDKVSPDPIPYVDLDFSSGFPKPVDEWIRALDLLVEERRNDPSVDRFGDKGCRVNVCRLQPHIKERVRQLGAEQLLKPFES
jgi:hypothetical protein